MKPEVKKFVHDRQPYGALEMEEATWTPIVAKEKDPDFVKHCAAKGYGVVTGIVTKGGTTSRLFQYTATRSEVGTVHEVWAVTPYEWSQGHKISVAM